jgi:hypothetical protein
MNEATKINSWIENYMSQRNNFKIRIKFICMNEATKINSWSQKLKITCHNVTTLKKLEISVFTYINEGNVPISHGGTK